MTSYFRRSIFWLFFIFFCNKFFFRIFFFSEVLFQGNFSQTIFSANYIKIIFRKLFILNIFSNFLQSHVPKKKFANKNILVKFKKNQPKKIYMKFLFMTAWLFLPILEILPQSIEQRKIYLLSHFRETRPSKTGITLPGTIRSLSKMFVDGVLQ